MAATNRLKWSTSFTASKTEDAVYAQIIQGLKDAEALPRASVYGAGDIGRATSGAAKRLLSKVYLTQKEW